MKNTHYASRLITFALLCCVLLGGNHPSAADLHPITSSAANRDVVLRAVDGAREKYRIPAMTIGVWKNDAQVIHLTRGLRAADSTNTATNNDLWHLGSCGKAMTAVMILRLVDRGLLQLDTPIVAYLPPAIRALTHPTLHTATLAHLLSHTSGMFDEKDWRNPIKGKAASRFMHISDSTEREYWQAVSMAVERKPEHVPGEVFQYSNLGYVLAGFIAAHVAGRSWQQLMREEVFQPLGMRNAGFGLPGSAALVDQPRGHEHGWRWLVIPTTKIVIPNQANADPAYYGAAGLIHMSMRDWATFLRMVLAGYHGQSSFLTQRSFARLLTPTKSKIFSDYGLGIRITKSADGKGIELDHTGSNGDWRAAFRVSTSQNRVVLMAANLGNESVDKAFEEVAKAIARALQSR
jgi:CubicO group peptidase (beta-lactamase class C family)